MRKWSLFRDFKSLWIVDSIAEIISKMHLEALEAGERSEKIRFVPWALAKDRPATGRRIYLRLWGSPEWLPDEASGALVGLKAELVVQNQRLNVDNKKAIACALTEITVTQPELKKRASRFIYEGKDVPVTGVILSEAAREIGVKRLLREARTASSSTAPDKEFEQRLRRSNKKVERLYSQAQKLQMIQTFASIPKSQVKKPEFLRVLARNGEVDSGELTSAYSFLMASVLRYPGRKLHFYHLLRQNYDKKLPTLQATAGELKQLMKLKYIANLRNHYYPIDYSIS